MVELLSVLKLSPRSYKSFVDLCFIVSVLVSSMFFFSIQLSSYNIPNKFYSNILSISE